MIEIDERLSIPEGELRMTATRSSGPGGQNVNKVNSRITLEFDVRSSPSLTEEQKARIEARLRTRISQEGVLQVNSQRFRTQQANREEAVRRFAALVRGALEEQKPRRKTRPTRASKERRVEEKKQRSAIKKTRGSAGFD